MSSRFLQKTRIVLTLLSVQQLCTAQTISLASQQVPMREQNTENRNRAKNLKDLLIDLGRKHQVSILFDEETVKNILVTGADYHQEANKLEKQLTDLLKPFNLRFKKAGKEAYVIIPRFEKKTVEPAIATIESATSSPVSATETFNTPQIAVSKNARIIPEEF